MNRKKYFYVDSEGYLISTLYLTEQEAKNRTDILSNEPPQRPLASSQITQEQTQLLQWASVRRVRNGLLAKTDWTQLPDVPLTTKEAWAAYRQALRDITLQPDPFNITWPAAPG